MNNNKRAFFFACNETFLFTFSVMLLSLKKYSPKALENTDVFLYYQGLTDEDKALVTKIFPVKFVEYSFPLDVDVQHRNMTRYTQLAYARYEIFDMLDEYEKVLYMDVDMYVAREINFIFEDFGSVSGLALSEDTQKGLSLISKNFITPLDGYDMTVNGLNTGVILFCNNIKRRGELRKWCYEKTIEWIDNLTCPDQGVINAMVQEFDIDVEVLPSGVNCMPSQKLYYSKLEKAYVYHCAGGGVRFWVYSYNSEWEALYADYLSLGGTSRPAPDNDSKWRKLIKKHKLYRYDFFNRSLNPDIHLGRFIKYLFSYPYSYIIRKVK